MMSNVPKLRFKEFNGEWKEKKLKTISIKIGSGSTPRGGEQVYKTSGIPFIRSQNVNNNKLIFDDVTYIDDEIHSSMKNSCVRANDILLNITGASIGRSCVVPSTFNDGNVNQHVCIIRLNDAHSPTFLQPFLASHNGQKLIYKGQTGSGREGINFQSIGAFKIKLPQKQEQEKIALFLTSVDTKIELLTKKEALLQQYKKGVMQKIFNQEIRFKADDGSDYPEWEKKKLGEVSYITTGKSNREDSGTEGQYTFFDRSEDIRTSDIYLFDKEAIIIAGEGSDFPPKYFKGKFDLHQRTYAIMDFIDTNAKYLFSYLHFYRSYFERYAVGSTVKSLRLPIFQNMNIKLPYLKEQTKIANFLSSIDTKIEHIQKQLDSTKAFKKALLQQMFV